MDFQIDKGLAMPAKKVRRGYAFVREMEVGDSFFFHPASPAVSGNLTRFYAPLKFIGRSVTEGGVVGTRIWRAA